MKKAIILLITHTFLALLVWGLVTEHFKTNVLPGTRNHISADPRYIKLSENQDPVEYPKILSRRYLGLMYLYDPVFKSDRQKGKHILSGLAHLGYTPAAHDLHDYYITRAYDFAIFHAEGRFVIASKENYKQAYHWARLALEQGSAIPMSFLIKFYELDRYKDVSREIAMMETIAKRASIPAYAVILSEYYAKHDKVDQARHWAGVAEKIENGGTHSAGYEAYIISPWRGL